MRKFFKFPSIVVGGIWAICTSVQVSPGILYGISGIDNADKNGRRRGDRKTKSVFGAYWQDRDTSWARGQPIGKLTTFRFSRSRIRYVVRLVRCSATGLIFGKGRFSGFHIPRHWLPQATRACI